MKTITKITALATSTLLIGVLAGPAKAAPAESAPTRESSAPVSLITAPTVKLSYERPTVTTTKADVPAPATVEVQSGPEAPPAVAPVSAPVRAASVPTPVTAPVASNKGAALVSAALAQVGIAQDCTAMVENALRAVGVAGVGDESPYSLARFGTPVASAQPGDILIYADAGAGTPHVAIYIGNGQAVHGGFSGSTVVTSANLGSGYTAYRVA